MRQRSLTAILQVIFFLTALGLLRPAGFASSFLPTPDELANLPAAVKQSHRQAAASALALAPANQDYVQIDDMRFRKADAQIQSGFYGSLWPNGKVYYTFDPGVST
ncbi:MAG: hypothetical protein NTX50_24730, partial [Candidatus Sumerlaeota bacterium]|nr:hypothetical protein [Candidatus Sumerlaeota bacterium]